jgi:hypothetical protein
MKNLFIALWFAIATTAVVMWAIPHTLADEDDSIILYAGQDIPVGTVEVENDEEFLYVTYLLDEPWCMTESHLHVGEDEK